MKYKFRNGNKPSASMLKPSYLTLTGPNSIPRRGNGKFWNGIKNIFSKSKILSNAANLIPFAGPVISESIANLGYGKRRRRRTTGRRRRGRGFFSKLKNGFNKIVNTGKAINQKMKDGKYISTYAPTASKIIGKLGDITGNQSIQKAAAVASDIGTRAASLGYGKPSRRRSGRGKLAINGMGGMYGGGVITPQGRLNNFINKRLAMAR